MNLLPERKHPWLPYLGAFELPLASKMYLGLDPRFTWKTFAFDWLDFGFLFFAWAVEPKE